MSTTARKARKRAGIKFEKAEKVGTPVADRSFVTQPVQRASGDGIPAGFKSLTAPRSPKRVKKFIKSGGVAR